MNRLSILKHPSAYLPPAMSLGALATVLLFVASHGTAPQADEGTAAHTWQILMAGQAPIALYFAIKWVPRSPRRGAIIVVLQVVAARRDGARLPAPLVGLARRQRQRP